jgi:hypothetical protein
MIYIKILFFAVIVSVVNCSYEAALASALIKISAIAYLPIANASVQCPTCSDISSF